MEELYGDELRGDEFRRRDAVSPGFPVSVPLRLHRIRPLSCNAPHPVCFPSTPPPTRREGWCDWPALHPTAPLHVSAFSCGGAVRAQLRRPGTAPSDRRSPPCHGTSRRVRRPHSPSRAACGVAHSGSDVTHDQLCFAAPQVPPRSRSAGTDGFPGLPQKTDDLLLRRARPLRPNLLQKGSIR